MNTSDSDPIKNTDSTPASHRFWEWLGLFSILVLAAGLRLWGLEQNGFGNAYYAAAVRSMLMNWHNFFFASFDPAGWVSVDKPPVALWIQTLSAKLMGYSAFSLIFPQVVEGCLSVAMVYLLVRRRFDAWAAFLAALAMAVGPICVAVDRYNNVDECLVFVILLAAWAMTIAVEKASRWLLLAAMALVGIGFNVKMMVAFIVLPAFYLLYWAGAAVPWRRRFADLTIASVVLFIVALSWPLTVDFTPPSQRPFVGSTQDNSMISLSLGWNGFQRILSRRRGWPVTPAATPTATANATPTPSADQLQTAPVSAQGIQRDANGSGPVSQGRRGGRRGFGGMGSGQPGPLRLADKNMAGQIIWFLPLLLLGLWAAFKKMPLTSPLHPTHSALLLWFGWFLIYGLVFSFMRGAMHTYYIVMLAPPLSALTGIGIRALWKSFQEGERVWVLLPLAFLLTAAWQIYIWSEFPGWEAAVWPILISGVGLALIGLIGLRGGVQKGKLSHRWMPTAFVIGLLTLFVSPVIWSLTAVLAPDRSVEANPQLLSGNGGQGFSLPGFGVETNTQKLVSFLEANRHGEKYIVAAQNSQSVSSIIIQTGEPAISIGGFMGGDPTITLDQFVQMVKIHQLRYMFLTGAPLRQGFGGQVGWGGFGGGDPNSDRAKIAQWVRANGQLVDPALWRVERPHSETMDSNLAAQGNNSAPNNGFGGQRRGMNAELYDLNP
jgi:4-amino-4-deoxy-L-arabinose transferase-like glycosyltransferase